MPKKAGPAALTLEEKKVIKALLAKGERNQDVHALINYDRPTTVNAGRISGVKKALDIPEATAEELEFFQKKKNSYDPITKLNLYDDECLIRSREAMILAVSIFNSASLRFKTEVFAVLANVAWTYLMHEHYRRRGINPENEDGSSFALSYILKREDCPLSNGIRNNLTAVKAIRDDVEHKLLRRSDIKWLSIFQACCLNYDKTITDWFGHRVSLQHELSVSLQFSKLDMEHAAQLASYDVPGHITALDALLTKDMSEEELDDLEFQFRVVYTLDSASKSKSHFEFLQPESEAGKQVQFVLQKFKIGDELFPHKPGDVCKKVRIATGKKFSQNDHTLAWKRHKVRPNSNSAQPDKTNREYCIYHKSHQDYTYNDKWISVLVAELLVPLVP